MKNSTKWIATVATAAAIFFSVNVKAQTTEKSKWRLGFGIEGGIPTGTLHTDPAYSKFELGGTARLQYGVANNVALTLTSGYYNFFVTDVYKAAPTYGESFGVVPVKLGIKGFVTNNIYLGAEAGAGFETKYDKNTKLLLSPAVGWANQSWDIGVRYENMSGQSDSYGVVALRLAYGFAL